MIKEFLDFIENDPEVSNQIKENNISINVLGYTYTLSATGKINRFLVNAIYKFMILNGYQPLLKQIA